jgi:ribokinase
VPEKNSFRQPKEFTTRKKKIVVLGSLNYDIFLKMDRLPEKGETLAADDEVFKAFGGKGANQAIAAARATKDCTVQMLG